MMRPKPAAHHATQHGARQVEGGGQVDRDHLVPLLVLHAHEELVAGDAGIVDEDVELAQRRLGGGHELVDLRRGRRDCREARGRARRARRRAPRAPRAACPRAPTIAPCAWSALAMRAADAAARAGDQRPSCRSDRTWSALVPASCRASPRPRRCRPACRPTASPRPSAMRLARPDSTLPAPSSTNSVDAGAGRATRSLSRQRTMPVTCSTRRRRISSGSLIGPAVTLATSGTAGALHRRRLASASRHHRRGRRHQRAMERARSPAGASRACAPVALAISTARSTAALSPEMTTCPAPLSLAAVADLALRRLGGDLAGRVEVEAEERRHRAPPDRHRLLHGLAADAEQPRGIGDG